MLVDSYKLRFGETGTVRFKYMAQCMQNIVKTLLDGNYGILLFGDNKDCKFGNLMIISYF